MYCTLDSSDSSQLKLSSNSIELKSNPANPARTQEVHKVNDDNLSGVSNSGLHSTFSNDAMYCALDSSDSSQLKLSSNTGEVINDDAMECTLDTDEVMNAKLYEEKQRERKNYGFR